MTQLAFTARSFVYRKHARSGSMAVADGKAFSYNKCIAEHAHDDELGAIVLVCAEKYSVTTSKHTNAIIRSLVDNGYKHVGTHSDGRMIYK